MAALLECIIIRSLVPIVHSEVGRLGLRTAIPSAIHILDIEHKALNLWEGQSRNTEMFKVHRSQQEIRFGVFIPTGHEDLGAPPYPQQKQLKE